jgi:hypothetical protein
MSRRNIFFVAASWLGFLLSALAAEPQRSVSVRIGWGCIDVPATYRVVAKPTSIIDQAYGYIIAPSKPEVEWMFGFSQAHPYCHRKCKTIWQRNEVLGGREREVGLLDDAGAKAFFVADDLISFRIKADDGSTLNYLRELTAGYQRRDDYERCRTIEKP